MTLEDTKPFSQACLNNRQPILAVLERVFADASSVLEIGSGTGQHGVYFANKLPHLRWQMSDLPENLPGIRLWLEEWRLKAPESVEQPRHLPEPLALDVLGAWPELAFDAAFSANTAHIMAWPAVPAMFNEVAARLPEGGVFAVYGPFNYEGAFTSESNARFDSWLKANSPERGIRDFEKMDGAARHAGLELVEDNPMPANNRLLVWRKPRI